MQVFLLQVKRYLLQVIPRCQQLKKSCFLPLYRPKQNSIKHLILFMSTRVKVKLDFRHMLNRKRIPISTWMGKGEFNWFNLVDKAAQSQLYPENWHLKYKQQLELYSISTSISTGFSFRTNTMSSLSDSPKSGSPKSSFGSSLKTTWEDSGSLEASKGSSKTLVR